MEFKGTIIHYEDKAFGVAYVEYSHFRNEGSLKKVKQICSQYFSDLPLLIACEDTINNSIFYGDEKLIELLDKVKKDNIEWKTYMV